MTNKDSTQKYLKAYDIILDHIRAEGVAMELAKDKAEYLSHYFLQEAYQNLFDELMQRLEGI